MLFLNGTLGKIWQDGLSWSSMRIKLASFSELSKSCLTPLVESLVEGGILHGENGRTSNALRVGSPKEAVGCDGDRKKSSNRSPQHRHRDLHRQHHVGMFFGMLLHMFALLGCLELAAAAPFGTSCFHDFSYNGYGRTGFCRRVHPYSRGRGLGAEYRSTELTPLSGGSGERRSAESSNPGFFATMLYWARPVELLKVFEFGGGPGRERKVLSHFSFSFRYSFLSSFVSGQSQSVLCPSQPLSFSSVFW